ncbi:MAG: cytochrome c biogenesis protein CcsA [Gammaproteobacteria bacterium]|nr:cytochrome c biogenesis protein CcsA [Gammaproteobacteria bacterium]
MNAAFGFIALILYLACTLGLVFRIQGTSKFKDQAITTLLVPGFVGVVFHLISLYSSLITDFGLQFGFFSAASTIGAVNSLLILLMSLKRQTELLATIVLPISALAILLEMLFPGGYFLPPDSATGLQIHVLISIVAYSLLGLAALMSLILAVQNHLLHNHHPGGLLRHLPPLQIMEKLLFDSIVAGFIGLSIALITGFIFLDDLFAQHLVHKTILAIIAWLVFAILLTGRAIMGWRGRTAIRWTLSGFVSLMLAYFGSKFVLEFILAS